jgi:hypothetical protein
MQIHDRFRTRQRWRRLDAPGRKLQAAWSQEAGPMITIIGANDYKWQSRDHEELRTQEHPNTKSRAYLIVSSDIGGAERQDRTARQRLLANDSKCFLALSAH